LFIYITHRNIKRRSSFRYDLPLPSTLLFLLRVHLILYALLLSEFLLLNQRLRDTIFDVSKFCFIQCVAIGIEREYLCKLEVSLIECCGNALNIKPIKLRFFWCEPFILGAKQCAQILNFRPNLTLPGGSEKCGAE